MTWSPTKAILTPRAIPVNLLTYAIDATRQADALAWAGDGTLKLIKEYSSSIANRVQLIYPSVAYAQDDDAADMANDLRLSVYSATFEFQIQNANSDLATTNARIYDAAFRSMWTNIPDATVKANTGATDIKLQSIETAFGEIKSNDAINDFLQSFQVRMIYAVWIADN